VRVLPQKGIEIHLQKRFVRNREYDPLNHLKWETIGESLSKKRRESFLGAASREIQEELGLGKNFKRFRIIGSDGKRSFTTIPGSRVEWIPNPICSINQLQGAQQWEGIGFVAVIPPDIDPKQDKEGETAGHRWLSPDKLLKDLIQHPGNYMSLHYPVILQACDMIVYNSSFRQKILNVQFKQ